MILTNAIILASCTVSFILTMKSDEIDDVKFQSKMFMLIIILSQSWIILAKIAEPK